MMWHPVSFRPKSNTIDIISERFLVSLDGIEADDIARYNFETNTWRSCIDNLVIKPKFWTTLPKVN